MTKITRIKYFTPEKKALISAENQELYDKYLRTSISKNRDVKDSTYKLYANYMSHFLVFLAEHWDNVGLYNDEFLDNAVDIMEEYISFLQDELMNNKKVINTKISTVSSFYGWSLKRKLVKRHPFDKQLERMKGAQDEKIISSHFLANEEIELITEGLKNNPKYDIQDQIIWNLMLDSCNRVGAISKLTLSSLNLDTMMFVEIREKRGKMVEVVFEDYTKELIETWLETRKDTDNCEIDSLLITRMNGQYQPMRKGTIQYRIKEIGKVIGIEDFRSHSIRKTALNKIFEETGDLDLAASMANHSSIETTRQSYIKPKSKGDVRQKIAEKKKEKAEQKEKEAST